MSKQVIVVGAALGVSVASLSGCAHVATPLDEDYRLGDNVAHYCETTDETVRLAGRLMAKRAGLTLPDLCAAHELVGGEVPEYDEKA